MKTLLFVLFCILFFVSCMQDEDKFSCDPVLNEYVSTHQTELMKLAIRDFASADLEFQQAAFRSFSPAKKLEIWIEKIQYLLDNENYSEAEYAHVQKLLNHLQENYFSAENLESNSKERVLFASSWISEAKSNFNWTDKYIAFVVYRLYINQSQFDLELKFLNSITQDTSENPGGNNCSCNLSASFCSNSVCISGSCSISSGCGWLWSDPCNGVCNLV